mgnify:CR=1 FL=1
MDALGSDFDFMSDCLCYCGSEKKSDEAVIRLIKKFSCGAAGELPIAAVRISMSEKEISE